MRELLLSVSEIRDEQGVMHSYEYSILIDEMDVGTFSCESYGLKIEEKESGQCCAVPHITTSISRIDELSELVLVGTVTPATLRDVVMDWL